jgi:hypothetical protein
MVFPSLVWRHAATLSVDFRTVSHNNEVVKDYLRNGTKKEAGLGRIGEGG